MEGNVAGKRNRGKSIQRWEKDITDKFGTMAAASRVAEDKRNLGSEPVTSCRGYALRR